MTTGPRRVFHISLGLRSPFLFPRLGTETVGIDAEPLRREPQPGTAPSAVEPPILPADHLKGLLRLACESLLATNSPRYGNPKLSCDDLFGQKSRDPFESPSRGALIFADLVAAPRAAGDWKSGRTIVHRVEIDDSTGAAKRGHLLMAELAAPRGETVTFVGDVVAHMSDAEAQACERLLYDALALVPFFGAERSVGFGQPIEGTTTVTLAAVAPAPNPTPPPPGGFVVDMTFDRPWLVDAEPVADNVFQGRTVAPGAVIKGALADNLRRRGVDIGKADMTDALSELLVSHAFPVGPSGALLDRAPPLSTMASQLARPRDARGDGSEDGIIDGRCADFRGDMKRALKDEVALLFARSSANLGVDARGHTAMDSKRGAAKDGELFVEAARRTTKEVRVQRQRTIQSQKVRFTLDFSAVAAAPAAQIWGQFLAGFDAIGKTRARATFAFVEGIGKIGDPSAPPPWRLLLETPAALVDLDHDRAPTELDGRPKSAREQLTIYFEALAPDLQLDDCFLSVRRVGGHPAKRLRAKLGEPYAPFVLFEPGCAFDLAPAPGVAVTTAAKAVGDILRNGLRPSRWLAGGKPQFNDDWQVNVYQPQSGFGAVSLLAPRPTGGAP